jgi:predicted transcriptional regulator of viral defense system
MSGESFRAGVETHHIEGVDVKIYSAAKTVADCFKFRNKIGTDIAVEALRDFTHKFPDGADDLWRFAGICRVRRVMEPYLEAIG